MIAQHGDAFGIQLVNAPRAIAAVAHQPRVLQNAEVLGDGRAGNGQPRGQLVHRPWRSAQHFEDGQPGGVAQCCQSVLYVSVHLR